MPEMFQIHGVILLAHLNSQMVSNETWEITVYGELKAVNLLA